MSLHPSILCCQKWNESWIYTYAEELNLHLNQALSIIVAEWSWIGAWIYTARIEFKIVGVKPYPYFNLSQISTTSEVPPPALYWTWWLGFTTQNWGFPGSHLEIMVPIRNYWRKVVRSFCKHLLKSSQRHGETKKYHKTGKMCSWWLTQWIWCTSDEEDNNTYSIQRQITNVMQIATSSRMLSLPCFVFISKLCPITITKNSIA